MALSIWNVWNSTLSSDQFAWWLSLVSIAPRAVRISWCGLRHEVKGYQCKWLISGTTLDCLFFADFRLLLH
jgi:hypothetical protein